MCRFLVWGLVLLVPLPSLCAQETKKDEDKGMRIEGKLSPDDPKDKVMAKSPHQVHTMKMKEGQTYQIDLVSRAFDTLLRLEDESGKQLAVDDDGGEGSNSRLFFKAPGDGSYRLIATSFDGKSGAYTLTVKVASGTTVAANQAFTAALTRVRNVFGVAQRQVNLDYAQSKSDEERDKVFAAFGKKMEELAEPFDKLAKDYPDENGGKQAKQVAQQLRSMVASVKGRIIVGAGEALRAAYEKAFEGKAPDADALYEKARAYFAEAVDKHAKDAAVAAELKDGLFLLEKLSIGKTAPDIEGEDLDGKKFKLSDYRGKVVVLDFWGNW